MADVLIHPGHLQGTVVPPPSKSDAHRALIAAGLARGDGHVTGLSEPVSEDIQATRRCMKALQEHTEYLDCGESGTTLRLLIPVAAASGAAKTRPVVFRGSGRLPHRPLAEYESIFAGHGVSLSFPDDVYLPLTVQGQLTPGVFKVPGHISSQYLSGLLLALPLLDGDSVIQLTSPLESAPYVDMTLETMRRFGVLADKTPDGFCIAGNQQYTACNYAVEKDYSQAAFWLVARYAGSDLKVNGLDRHSVQGDQAILNLLEDFEESRDHYVIDVSQIPDLVPILAVAAALTPATTELVNGARLRLKESDRLMTTCEALSAIGATIRIVGDGLVIGGGKPLDGGTAQSYNDHRIAMALSIAALSTRQGVRLSGAEAVRKSYPDFFRELKRLGGEIDGLDLGQSSENFDLW